MLLPKIENSGKIMSLKEGCKIWVVQEYQDETNMLAIPAKPQSGIFLKVDEWGGAMVFVDNDLLHVCLDEMFLDENSAWKKWHDRMNYKINVLQQQTQEVMAVKKQYAHTKS